MEKIHKEEVHRTNRSLQFSVLLRTFTRMIFTTRITRCHGRSNCAGLALCFGWGLALLSLGVLVPLISLAQTAKDPTLPPAAQEAMKKGVLAAKEQEWTIAIQNFQEARKTAPVAPIVFYNLGLA